VDHALIIRLKYPDCPEFEWRFNYFASMCLPRLLKQTDQDFDLFVLCNPIHDKRIKALSDKIQVLHADARAVTMVSDYNRKSGESNSVEPFDFKMDYKIQTRIDSDDLVHPDFIKVIHDELKDENILTLIAFKPIRFNIHNLRLYYIYPKDGAYSKSQFLSIYNPDKSTFIYERGHRGWASRIRNMGGQVKIIPFGYAFLSLHNLNASCRPQPGDVLI